MNYWINDVYYDEKNMKNEIMTIFEKCSTKNIDLPCFCFQPSLSIAGNCRICLVEINVSLKLVVSCSMLLQNNFKVYTSNYRVRKARESILEFLLVNHPLDCPICDQGGECDLQDIVLVYGSDKSRFYEYAKRAVYDKECGPFVKMIMTRCIHCTRCVRFLSEISNNYEFGLVNRGVNSEITTFIKKSLSDELSGNIIDLCPVGALTSKPFAFTARSWEINNLESIDILDSLASSIRVDFLNNKIYRILPIYNKFINEDWITNKIRFCYDSFNIQRLYFPFLKLNDKFVVINWFDGFSLFFFKFFEYMINGYIYSFFGNFFDIESVNYFKKFINFLGVDLYLIDNYFLINDFRYNYLFLDISEDFLNYVIIVNLRVELPLLHSKLRRNFLKRNVNIFNFINKDGLGLFLNNNFFSFLKVFSFKNIVNLKIFFNNFFYSNFNFLKIVNSLQFLLGINFFIKENFNILNNLSFLKNKFYKFNINVVISNISLISLFEFSYFKKNNIFLNIFKNSFIFFNNIDDEIFLNKFYKERENNNFLVYIGSFFDNGANISNLILPINMFFEYNGFFLNLLGKIRKSNKIISTKNFLFNLYDLFKSLYYFFRLKLDNYNFFFKLNKFLLFFKFLNLNWIFEISFNMELRKFLLELKSYEKFIRWNEYENNIIKSLIFNYYKNDVISKNSKNLSLAALDYLSKLSNF